MLISDFKNRLQSKIHGQSLNKVQDIYGLIYEGAGNLLLKVDPQETKRVATISNALYDQVYDYAVPNDLKGDRIIAIRPQVNNNPSNSIRYNSTEAFDKTKGLGGKQFTINFDDFVKTIRLDIPTRAGVLINPCNSLTSTGTWAATANATNLAVDTINYITNSASLKFDLSAGGTSGYIENSTMTAVDLTNYVNTGSLFIWAYIPSSAVTSISLRWGNDSSNYYSSTATTNIFGNSFEIGWNLVQFVWSAATQTGTVTPTTVDYIRVTFAYNGTATPSCRVDSIMAKLPTLWEMVYYSRFLFRNSSGTWLERPTADTDLINLDTEGINVLLYEIGQIVAQELGGEDAEADITFFTEREKANRIAYMNRYKSEAIKKNETYYRFPLNRNRRR